MNLDVTAVECALTKQLPSREFNIILSPSTWTLLDTSVIHAKNYVPLKILYLFIDLEFIEINNVLSQDGLRWMQ